MKEKKQRIVINGILIALLIIAMFPLNAFAAEDSLDNLVMNKQAWLEDDGTYTIQLDAYAKGNVSTETIQVVKPADIILVLDQSGSMAQEEISGIPGNSYSEVTGVTNKDLTEGTYYYKDEYDNHHKIIAKKEVISSNVGWLGQDGKEYTAKEISYSWTDSRDREYTTATPFVTDSLSTWTRDHSETNIIIKVQVFWYVNDITAEENKSSLSLSANAAREHFRTTFEDADHTIEFHNDGAPGITTEEDDGFYVAAVYTAVTRQEIKTYRYTYSYIDEYGKEHVIGQSTTGTETEVDGTVCSISPIYKRETTPGTRLDALKYAANEFIDNIRESAMKNGVAHRVAVVGFASNAYTGKNSEYYYSNTELFKGADQYNYVEGGKSSTYNDTGNLASDQYATAYQDVSTDAGYSALQDSVEALAGNGGTHPSLGFDMANGIFDKNSNVETDGTTRTRIVIFLTDGQPGDDADNFDTTEADATIENANLAKETYGAKVYTVAVLNESEATTAINEFLNRVSSSGTYTLATDVDKLAGFFETVDKDINNTNTTVTLSEHAILLDRMSEYFVVPDGFSIENNVMVQIAKHVGYDAFSTPTVANGIKPALSMSSDETEVRGISVSDFNYVAEENLVTTNDSGNSIVATGNKLIVTITGLLAKDDAATNTYIDTNTADAGIWDTDEQGAYGLLKAFNMPSTMITKKAYVIDYAKEAELSLFDTSVRCLDEDEDLRFSKVSAEAITLDEKYGKANIADGKLTFAPSTTNWSGFDSFYALGKDSEVGDHKTKNIWSKVSVIPANNVYYEDDFVTDTISGIVGIEYSGEWNTEGTSSGNTESPNTEIHGGWENTDLLDDAQYTDGISHVSNSPGAVATFTFTGTGVDVYSRTNMTAGVVKAQLFKGEETKITAMTKSYLIDNLAESGDYFQIPTVSFCELDHGTYTVKLTVVSKATGDTVRSTYYLDGIRVYNPLSVGQEMDDIVSEGYGEEIGAFFTEVRDILIDTGSFDAESTDTADGVVFIDKNSNTGEGEEQNSTSVIGTYVEYGPKNEVYLAKGQAIAFGTYPDAKYSIGLKAPAGGTKAKITKGSQTSEIEITASSDLYYAIEPNADGLILVRNTGENLLSVTKLKTTGEIAVGEVSVMSLLAYSDEFDTLPVVDYAPETEEEVLPDADDKADTDNKEDIESEQGGDENTGNIEIENPEVEETPNYEEELRKLVNGIFNVFRNWFGR